MKTKKIKYSRLEKILRRLGYSPHTSPSQITFRHPKTNLPIFLPRMKKTETLQPFDLISVRNALANAGIVDKDKFDSLFSPEPLQLWHYIIDAEADFESEHGSKPQLLKLPILQAYDLAKLRRGQIGELSGKVMRDGIKVFEKEGLLGVQVKLVNDEEEFEFE